MRNFFQRLMFGRYGSDALNNALLAVCLVLMLIARIFHVGVLNGVAVALLLLCYIRVFSRNIPARRQENQKFLAAAQPVGRWLLNRRMRFLDRKTHRYFTCPSCGMTLRVPKGRGKISITCPKCRAQFIKKT